MKRSPRATLPAKREPSELTGRDVTWRQAAGCQQPDMPAALGRMCVSHTLTAHTSRMERKQKEGEQTCGSRDRRFNKGSKSHVHKQNERSNSFAASHWQADVQPLPGKQGFSTQNSYLETPMPQLWVFPLPPSFPELFLAEHAAIWQGMSLWSHQVSWPGYVIFQTLPPQQGQ